MAAIVEALRSVWGLWLMIVFLGIVFWAFRPRNRGRFESYGDIPLRDDEDDVPVRDGENKERLNGSG